MDTETFLRLKQQWHEEAMSVASKKQHDYTSGHDALSNFRFSGYVLDFFAQRGASPAVLGCVNMIATKLARLAELQGKGAVNESEEDTLMDLSNYVDLLRAIRQEERSQLATQPPPTQPPPTQLPATQSPTTQPSTTQPPLPQSPSPTRLGRFMTTLAHMT